MLAELAVVGTKRCVKVGIDVEFADDLAVRKDGHDDFGLGFERARKIAGVGADVINDNGFAARGCRAADSLIQRDARVGRHGALKRTEEQDVVVAFVFEHVKTDPIIAREFLVE